MIGKEVIFRRSKNHEGKVAIITDIEPSGNFTIEYADGTKITEVPNSDLLFL